MWFVGSGLSRCDARFTITPVIRSAGPALLSLLYLYLGEAEDDVAPIWEVEVTGFNFSAVGIIPVNAQVDVFGKIGMFMWDVELSEQGYGKLGEDDGTDLSLGLGAAFHVTQEFSVVAEFQRFTDVSDGDLNNFSVGARLNF